MDDYENDGRDYGENIDEGPTNVETEGYFSSSKPESKDGILKKQECNKQEQKKKDSKKNESKKQQPEKPSIGSNSGKCMCKTAKGSKHRRRNKELKKEKVLRGKQVRKGRRGRKRKERRLVNPFIIFYLEMYYKNPKKCITEVAREAGKAWSSMPLKQKEEYINKARKSQSTKMIKKNKKKSEKSPGPV